MKVGDYFSKGSVPDRIANAKGRYSNQFMSGDTNYDQSVRVKNLTNVRKEGFDGSIKKQSTNRTETNQPMARYSEFWYG